jgi:hypothetical protein
MTTPGTSVVTLPAYSAPAFSAPAVAVDAAVTTATLESTTASAQTNVPFTFGQAFKKGDIAPGNFLIGRTSGQADVPLQFNVKATHPDGSVRFAIISGVLPSLAANGTRVLSLVRVASSAANTTPTASSALTSAGFTASLAMTIGGVAYTASPNAALAAGMAGSSVHIGGSVATEWSMMLPLVDGSGNAHPLLAAQFNVRHYPGAARAKVGVTIENTNAYGTIDNVAYAATLTIGGAQVYTYPSVTHYHATRFYREAWWGGQPALHVRHNSAYLTASKQVPNYDLSVSMSQTKLDEWAGLINDAAKFGPMGAGPYNPYMPATGGREDIGLNPSWAAATVISMDKRAKALTLAGAACGGSWACHRRDVSTGPGRGYPLSVVNFPRATWQGGFGDGYNGDTGQNEKLPGVSGNPNTEDNAHTPNFSYVAYLLTGDLFYLEEILFYSTWVVYYVNPGYRQSEKGVLDSTSMDQIRAQGWAIRALADAAAITPDAHYLKMHFRYWLDNTLATQNGKFTDNPSANGLGVNDSYLPYDSPLGGGKTAVAFWQDDHFTSAVGHAAELGFAEAGRLLQWKAKFQIARLLHPDWCYQDACLYNIAIKGRYDYATFNTWAEVKAGTVGSFQEGRGNFDAATIAQACGSPARLTAMNAGRAMPSDPIIAGQITGYAQYADGFVANFQPALAYAVDSGYTDGDLAWDLFDSRTVKPDYGFSPQFAIVPRGDLITPPADPVDPVDPVDPSPTGPLVTVSWAVFDTLATAETETPPDTPADPGVQVLVRFHVLPKKVLAAIHLSQ